MKEETDYFYKYIVKLNKDKFIIYLEKGKEYYPGDILNVNGILEKPNEPTNYKEYNYKNYLKTQKIYGIIKVEKCEYIKTQKDFNYFIGKLQKLCRDKLDKLYKKNESVFLRGILLGDAKDIDEDTKTNFRKSSVSHILAISGLHVTYVINGIEVVFSKMIKSKKNKNIILIIILIIFIFFTGGSPSCIRACFMNIMIILGDLVHRKNNAYRSYFLSLFVLIIINPFNIFNVGMWLSYFATIRNFFI